MRVLEWIHIPSSSSPWHFPQIHTPYAHSPEFGRAVGRDSVLFIPTLSLVQPTVAERIEPTCHLLSGLRKFWRQWLYNIWVLRPCIGQPGKPFHYICVKNSCLNEESHWAVSYVMPFFDCYKDGKRRRNYFEDERLEKKDLSFPLGLI